MRNKISIIHLESTVTSMLRRGVCEVRGEVGTTDLVCWTASGWLLGDGRVAPPGDVLSVRGEGDFSLRERWLAFTFPGEGFAPVRVRGHRGGKWETDRGRVEVIHQPAPALIQDAVLRRTGGKLLKFDAIDLHTEALHRAYDIKRPGPAPYECRLVGYHGGCWRASGGQLLLPQDLALTGPTCAGATQFTVPIRCLDGAVATGYDGGRFVTESGPKATLVGPIPPRASTSEARIRAVLSRVPEELKSVTHREGVTRHVGVTSAEAAWAVARDPGRGRRRPPPAGRLRPGARRPRSSRSVASQKATATPPQG